MGTRFIRTRIKGPILGPIFQSARKPAVGNYVRLEFKVLGLAFRVGGIYVTVTWQDLKKKGSLLVEEPK